MPIRPEEARGASSAAPRIFREDVHEPMPGPVAEAVLREPECRRITGLSRSTRWRLARAGLFPQKRQLSPHCSGWLYSEIAAWLASRKQCREFWDRRDRSEPW